MNATTLSVAEREAREFLRRVKVLQNSNNAMRWLGVAGSKESAAVRRQSMELTRALANLRKHGGTKDDRPD